jgi:hypothetical protein
MDMKRFGIVTIALAAAIASLLPVIAQQQPPAGQAAPGGRGGPDGRGGARGGRGPAQPPPELTADQKSQYQSKIAELESIVKSLRAKKVNEDLIADINCRMASPRG